MLCTSLDIMSCQVTAAFVSDTQGTCSNQADPAGYDLTVASCAWFVLNEELGDSHEA